MPPPPDFAKVRLKAESSKHQADREPARARLLTSRAPLALTWLLGGEFPHAIIRFFGCRNTPMAPPAPARAVEKDPPIPTSQNNP
jgi:hypothetical protein